MTLLLALYGCPPEAAVDTADTAVEADTDTDTDADADSTAVFTSVAYDYSAGALGTVSLDDWSVDDELLALGTDVKLVVGDDAVYMLTRSSADHLRVYDPGSWNEPVLEIGLPKGGNGQDVERCGDKLFVSLYQEDQVNVYDPGTGTLSGTVDLSAYLDLQPNGSPTDGTPEASDMVQVDGTLYVALQQLDQNTWGANGGLLAEVDCAEEEVTRTWDVGPNPSLAAWGDDKIIVRTGAYYDYTDGGLAVFDAGQKSLSELHVAEKDLGVDLTSVAVAGDHAIVGSYGTSYSLHCLDLSTWELTDAESTANYLAGFAANDAGEVWIAAQAASWIDPDAGHGFLVYDAASCSSLIKGAYLETALNPNSVAFY